ncbi:MAG: nickel-dependent hydrogenase large subunit [Deltaproteobacteria bacterium]|nr:nickel-dependent hydrogenase large subunit [Deltaproteobacteria bacterium]
MATITVIDPVTRLEGHLKIKVAVDTVNGVQQVVDAWATGTLFRGFESILINRHPADAQHITQRICGVCPVSHGLAAVMALDQAYGITAPANARIMRNLVLGANMVDSHILHFYHLALPDFINGPDMPPWQPSWQVDKGRFSAGQTSTLVSHYVSALDMRRKAQEMGAIFGGRLPHPPTYIPGGFTTRPTSAMISQFKTYLSEITAFIENTYIPDALLLASLYDDYKGVGGGYGNLLAYGVFDLDAAGTNKLLRRGRTINASPDVQPVDVNAISEQVKYSWYNDRTDNLNPAVGVTTPQYPKNSRSLMRLMKANPQNLSLFGAYSWMKAPRYEGLPYETGALARMWVNGDYKAGVSVMDRHLARAYETLKVAEALLAWVNQINVNGSVAVSGRVPETASAIGLTEAPRGALGHWLQITDGKISRYQIITPTCWNASPRDAAGIRGPIEQALIGTPVQDVNQPIEVVRVIHSFDPCLSCAVHVMRPGEGKKIFTLHHSHGVEESHDHEHGHDHVH